MRIEIIVISLDVRCFFSPEATRADANQELNVRICKSLKLSSESMYLLLLYESLSVVKLLIFDESFKGH